MTDCLLKRDGIAEGCLHQEGDQKDGEIRRDAHWWQDG
jgi:hypothetical protein